MLPESAGVRKGGSAMKLGKYTLNPGHSLFGGYGYILSWDDSFAFIPLPLLESEAILVFIIAFKISLVMMWGNSL